MLSTRLSLVLRQLLFSDSGRPSVFICNFGNDSVAKLYKMTSCSSCFEGSVYWGVLTACGERLGVKICDRLADTSKHAVRISSRRYGLAEMLLVQSEAI